MNSSFYRFILDVQSVQSQISLPVSLYDTARTLYISFTDGGKPYAIETGCLAKLTITRPSGSKLHEFCAIEGNASVVYPFEQNQYTASEEGIHECEVSLYRNGKQITSPRFTMVVSDRVVNKDDNNGIDDESIGIIDDICRSEQERRQAELEREEAETIRIASEEGRATAEESRASAEKERVEAYQRIDHDTSEAINKILSEQENIIAIQESLIENGTTQERLAKIIALQESYIGGETE